MRPFTLVFMVSLLAGILAGCGFSQWYLDTRNMSDKKLRACESEIGQMQDCAAANDLESMKQLREQLQSLVEDPKSPAVSNPDLMAEVADQCPALVDRARVRCDEVRVLQMAAVANKSNQDPAPIRSRPVPAPQAGAAGEAEIVAVFDIEAKRLKVSRDFLDGLTDYLSARLTETGKFQVVPRAEIKKRLTLQTNASYKHCYDQSCQIEIGQELAAQKSLSTQIVKLGSSCTINSSLFDLRRATAEAAATVRGGCDEDALTASLGKVVDKLTSR